jgi:hypothetical protein
MLTAVVTSFTGPLEIIDRVNRDRAARQVRGRATWTATDRNRGRWACYVFVALSLAYVPAMGAGFIANGGLSAALLGAALGDLDVRNIGIVSYALVLPVVIVGMDRLFSVVPLTVIPVTGTRS